MLCCSPGLRLAVTHIFVETISAESPHNFILQCSVMPLSSSGCSGHLVQPLCTNLPALLPLQNVVGRARRKQVVVSATVSVCSIVAREGMRSHSGVVLQTSVRSAKWYEVLDDYLPRRLKTLGRIGVAESVSHKLHMFCVLKLRHIASMSAFSTERASPAIGL